MKSALGIRGQLITGIVLVTLAGIGLIGLMSVKLVETNAVYWKLSEARNIVKFTDAAFSGSSSLDEKGRMPDYARSVFASLGITDYTLTYAANGVVLSGGAEAQGGGVEIIGAGDDIRAWKTGGEWYSSVPGGLRISAPLGARRGKAAASVTFLMPLTGINAELSAARRFLLFYTLFDSAIIIIFGVYFVTKNIINPIRSLTETAGDYAAGRLWQRAAVGPDNEIGALGSSFNSMAGRLEDEIKSLERLNAELLTAQEELLRSKTMAAVGRLAAGIAHEIGNPLGAVRGYLDLLSRGGTDETEQKDISMRAAKEVARIDAIVRDFLDVARPARSTPSVTDVNAIVKEASSAFAADAAFDGVRIVLSLKDGLAGVMIDDGKLRQVFLNLLINAAHSMADMNGDKVVTVSTYMEERAVRSDAVGAKRRRSDTQLAVTEDAQTRRDYVCAAFSDTGCGISADDAAKLFEPFFTTRDAGKGSGLGLFVSETLIKALGGDITFTSKKGEGAAFTVALPAWSGTDENTDN